MNHTFYINNNIFNVLTFYIQELYIYDSFYALCVLIHNNPFFLLTIGFDDLSPGYIPNI